MGTFRFCARCCLLLLLAAPAVYSQSPQKPPLPPGDLSQASLEDLMNVEVVSASKKGQKLSRVAAAIFVITQEDIRRSGAANIADLLRMVPGVDVAQINGNTWAISARGLNGQFSNELLVTLDGRNVYTPTFGGVYWDTFDIPLENIERIEVIRGPGGTVWGENAVNGVINIIQKKAGDTKGAWLTAGGGNTTEEFSTAQYGGTVGKHTDYRLYAKYFDQDDMLPSAGNDGGDGWHMLRGGFRTDTVFSAKDSLTVQGDVYSGREGDPTTILPSITSTQRANAELLVNLSGGFLQSIWNHTYSARSDSALLVSYDQYERSDLLNDKRNTFDIDYHHHVAWSHRQDLVFGVAYRHSTENSEGTLSFSFNPERQATNVFSGFVQDEISLIPDRLYLTLGARVEHNSYTGFSPLPGARIAYSFSDRSMAWASVSRALRIPAELDVSSRINVVGVSEPDGTPALISLFGNPLVKNEGVIAYEIGYRASLAPNLTLDLAAYYTDYDHQISVEPVAPFLEPSPLPAHVVLPSVNENLLEGEAHGIEIAAQWKPLERWTISPSYDFARIHMHADPSSQDATSAPETNGGDPHHHARIRSHVELPHKFAWDLNAYFTSRLSAQDVPSYTRLDTGLTWRSTEHFSLSIFGQNLLQAQHLEFIDASGATNSTLMRRSWYAKVVWHF